METANAKCFDLVVIGGGPGGYVASIRAAQLGMSVACVDKAPSLGGTCLRVGCIPSKVLLESSAHFVFAGKQLAQHGVMVDGLRLDLGRMMKRKDQTVNLLGKGVETLFKKNKVTSLQGSARLMGAGAVEITSTDGTVSTLTSQHVLLATGSQPATLPQAPFDGERILSSKEVLSLDAVPEHLIVIGGGYIGLELGSVWNRLGSQVSVVERLPQVFPGMDGETALEAQRIFQRQGIRIHCGKQVSKVSRSGVQCHVFLEDGTSMDGSHILVAVGRKPYTQGLGLDALGVAMDHRGFVKVDAQFQTNVPGIFALGDLVPGPMLAHKAEEEAIAFAEQLSGMDTHVDHDAIPAVVYTHPELASIGATEEMLVEKGVAYRKGVFHFRANGRARASGNVDGWAKMLADEITDRILGVHILGQHAGELIHECAVAMRFNATSKDFSRICHAHPTFSEAVKESALALDARTIHA
ncbi:MAG: dihydrolipoyl dehydrogenase [Verrucomicrobiota bacterium]|jgi:dihydrolipoamide dehydrogenase|nr:dihydrolipoyl dehydrogenase [Verrucomicrobiota bacterium]